MTKTNIKKAIDNVKDNCDTFIELVHDYMVKTKWTWWDSPCTPTIPRLKYCFFELLDRLTESTEVSCGGFTVKICDNWIDCSFGNRVYRMSQRIDDDEPEDHVLDFIDKLCADCPILDRKYLMDKYYNRK